MDSVPLSDPSTTLFCSLHARTIISLSNQGNVYWTGWYFCLKLINQSHRHHRSSPCTFVKAAGGGSGELVILYRIFITSLAAIFYVVLVGCCSDCKFQQSEGFIISTHSLRGISYFSIYEITWLHRW